MSADQRENISGLPPACVSWSGKIGHGLSPKDSDPSPVLLDRFQRVVSTIWRLVCGFDMKNNFLRAILSGFRGPIWARRDRESPKFDGFSDLYAF